MKIRLMGTKEELDVYTKALEQNYADCVYQISEYYKNRGNTKYYRCYIELQPTEITIDETRLIPDRQVRH